MSAAPVSPNQPLVVLWVGQMIGTLVIAAAVIAYVRYAGAPFKNVDPSWAEYALVGALVAIAPAVLFLPDFKVRLDVDSERVKLSGGLVDLVVRRELQKSLAIGSALCELPQALGLVHLLLGGQTRWFVMATLVTLALRASYRPFPT